VVAAAASAAALGLTLHLAARLGMGRPLESALWLRSRLALGLSLRRALDPLRPGHPMRLPRRRRLALHARLALDAPLWRGAWRGTLDRTHGFTRRALLTRRRRPRTILAGPRGLRLRRTLETRAIATR